MEMQLFLKTILKIENDSQQAVTREENEFDNDTTTVKPPS